MTKPIEVIEGIGPSRGIVLREAGINTVDKLLEIASDKKGRSWLAGKTQISEPEILKWANMADLFRIRGIAGQYAELLELAGVDTVKDLQHRNAKNLASALAELNEEKHLVRKIPSVNIVNSWVRQAKQLPPLITH